jgi:YidC/Oxa1 family membrane protein insertase
MPGIFNTILYQPLLNILILFYQYLPGHDFGVAIIFVTILVRVILYPLGAQAIKSQKILQELQPKIKEIQTKYKDDKEKQMEATLELYKSAKINPLASLLPLLIQLPILYALYKVFWGGLNPAEMVYLYSFVPKPEQINSISLGLFNLNSPSVILAVLAGIFQFIQAKMLTPKTEKSSQGDVTEKMSAMIQKQTLYFFPILIFLFCLSLKAGLSLYWVATTIFSIIQQYIILKQNVKPI